MYKIIFSYFCNQIVLTEWKACPWIALLEESISKAGNSISWAKQLDKETSQLIIIRVAFFPTVSEPRFVIHRELCNTLESDQSDGNKVNGHAPRNHSNHTLLIKCTLWSCKTGPRPLNKIYYNYYSRRLTVITDAHEFPPYLIPFSYSPRFSRDNL